MSGEMRLADASGRFDLLYDVAQLISSSLDLDTVLNRVMDALVAVTGAERGFILLAGADGTLQVAVARNLNREQIESTSSGVSRSLCDRVFQGGKGEWVADALADTRTSARESIISYGIRSVLCAPLRARDKVIGVVYLDHRLEVSRFAERELRTLEAVGKQAGIAIENARLYGDLGNHAREIARLKAHQDNIFHSVATAIMDLDLQGRVVSLNRAAEQLFGISETDARGLSYPSLCGDALSARLLRGFMAAAEGTPSTAITASALLGGTERHLRCAVTPLHDADGATRGLILLAEDETARVLAEQAREREEAERRNIRDLFGRFVAESVVEQLVSDPKRAKLGGVKREVTIVFADIRGYTALSERNDPETLVEILGRYLTVAADSIMEQNGTLDKFMGDGVMAIFNAPLDQQDHALAAVRAALLMQRHAREQTDGVTFGVGVNTGEALVGNFGTERFRNYSCVGDAVNVTARLQAHAQGGEVLITDTTLAQVADHVVVEELGPIDVKGRVAPVLTYRLVAIRD